MDKPSIPKGTRDFTPAEMHRRNFIFGTIREVFERYGYMPIETPAMENLSTLLGKYGDEGDRLLFRILNSGNYLSGVDIDGFNESNLSGLTSRITEKGLRYDLTVPFARFVVQNRNDISFPFKRYQIQPVWRADRPQKGRYREFFQCDVDVIGSDSLLNEVELIQIIEDVFSGLGIDIRISLNNRKILAGIAAYIGAGERFSEMTVAIDKLEKIGTDGVVQELKNFGFSATEIEKLLPFIGFSGSYSRKTDFLREKLGGYETGLQGVNEISTVLDTLRDIGRDSYCDLDLTLARGLNYYTGTIIEVKSTGHAIGSICGGGRYDDLTGIFGLPGVSGVGISFGADRIYDVMEALKLFPSESGKSTDVLFINFGAGEAGYCLKLAQQLRSEKWSAEVYPDPAKLKKQMRYADQKSIPAVVLIGEEEMKQGLLTVKDMKSGDQYTVGSEDLIATLKNVLLR